MNCRHVAVMGAFLTLFFATCVWLAEMFSHPQMNKSFVFGASTGLWWSIVTMTTLGYGDFTPRSFIGRFVAIVTILIGLLTTISMTAIVLSGFSTNNIDLRDGKVASIVSSFEGSKVKENYDSNIKSYISYSEVLNAIRTGEAEYGIINADVASYIQKEIEDLQLAIVDLLPIATDVTEEVYKDITMLPQNITDCLQLHRSSIEKEAITKHRRVPRIATVYYADMLEFIKEDYILYPCIGIAGVCFFGILFEIAYRIRKWQLSRRSSGDVESKKESRNGHANGNTKVEEKIPAGKADGEIMKLRKDVTYIKDNMIKLSAMSFYKEKCPACSWQS